MEYDLDLLPAILASPKDILLVHKYPDNNFLDSLSNAGFGTIHLQLLNESLKDPDFLSKPKGFLYPWGWSPSIHKLFAPLKPSCAPEFLNSPVALWNPVHKELYSRKMARELLLNVLQNTNYNCFTSLSELPRVCSSHEEILSLQEKWNRVIVKSPWSSSGRGLQILRPGEYNRSNYQVITGFIRQQGYVMVEPFYDKILDISFQFYSKGNGQIDFLGICSFKTDRSGRYSGSYIEEIPFNTDSSLKDFFSEHLSETKDRIKKALINSPYSLHYQGWIGVDSIIYRTLDDGFKIQPCIEVNCRYTMGAIVLAIRERIAKGSGGFFSVQYKKEGDLKQFNQEQNLINPLIIDNNKIVKGFLPITPVLSNTSFGASLVINQKLK